MEVKEYLGLVAYKAPSDLLSDDEMIYKSKFDDSYVTRVGMESNVEFLADRGITEELTHGVGFSPRDNKWYGWSHRAIYGFDVGSTCRKGDCHYVSDTPEGLIDSHANFFADISKERADQKRAECQILPDRSGIGILHTPLKIPMIASMDELEEGLNNVDDLPTENLFENNYSVIKCGRGEWTAETLADAKQMAVAFNEGVS